MIGLWKTYSTEYLYVISVGTILLFGLPLLIAPIQWAKVLKWTIPDHQHLAIYFGRCLGGIICVMAFYGFMSTLDPGTMKFFFDFILLNFIAMVLIHVYGAMKKIQPKSETIEIIYWLFLVVVTLLFYPADQFI